jgi:D-alanyl-D-alanine carboxypeptidase/D-alanyl-D-alanine-endopeptidase (penicillin-binding protein 4)
MTPIANTPEPATIGKPGRFALALHVKALIAGLTLALTAVIAVPAQASEKPESANKSIKTWSTQVRDHATQSFNSDEALSVAVIPLNGP